MNLKEVLCDFSKDFSDGIKSAFANLAPFWTVFSNLFIYLNTSKTELDLISRTKKKGKYCTAKFQNERWKG